MVEDLAACASLCALQGQVLAEARVEAEGEGQALPHALTLLEAPRRRLDVQQVLRAVVVGQRHAAHEAEPNGIGTTYEYTAEML